MQVVVAVFLLFISYDLNVKLTCCVAFVFYMLCYVQFGGNLVPKVVTIFDIIVQFLKMCEKWYPPKILINV